MFWLRSALLALTCALAAGAADAAPTATSSCEDASGGGFQCDVTPSGTNRVLYIIDTYDQATIPATPTCTYGGSSTGITQIAVTTGTGQVIFIFRLIAPTAATTTVACGAGQYLQAVAWQDVDQATPNDAAQIFETANAGNPSTFTCTNATSAVGDTLMSSFNINSDMSIPGYTLNNATAIQDFQSGGSAYSVVLAQSTGAATVSPQLTNVTTNNVRGTCIAVNLNAVAAASGCTGSLALLGVGKCE